ncbi:MAG: Na+/H+ antiporter NhaA [Bacteroidota bacterium]
MISLINTKLRHHIITPLRDFLADSRAGGIVLILCTVTSLTLANLKGSGGSYINFWQTAIHFQVIHLPETYLLWVNDVLMTLFFFLVAMEIKRELTTGELASVKKSLLPVVGAFGGMVVPALIFLCFNANSSFKHGWGIPMATDIAFSLGVLSLLGKKVPVQLKIFLAALAIIDDLGAVITIAFFYTAKLNFIYLSLALACWGIVFWMGKAKVERLIFYLLPGMLLWYFLFNSGVHATISGVIMAFSIPLSKLNRMERYLQKPVTFFIMPLFALANTAILLPSHFGIVFTSTICFGILAGLVIGKPLGIFLFTFIATKLKIAALPAGTTYKQLFGMGVLGGIGFTMSIFTSNLAYNYESFLVISKVSIISASVIAACIGYIYMYRLDKIIALKTKDKDQSLFEQPALTFESSALV